ncbi:RAS protein activator like-3 [Frankliniella fusca]|uniref:RAS protein activator like-3 n=1 Tax=Frankliniella fusca TaxID=407009 RepID=A0AAE1I0Z5_9NEOP|nr:RAS protein activator like-3 [Frankliniella fusca]
MPVHCALCGSTRQQQPDRIFHLFPEQPEPRRLWMLYCGRTSPRPVLTNLFMCSTCCTQELLDIARCGRMPGAYLVAPRLPIEAPPLVPMFAEHPPATPGEPAAAAGCPSSSLSPPLTPAPESATDPEMGALKMETEFQCDDLVIDSIGSPTGARAPSPEQPAESSRAASGHETAGVRIRCKPLEALLSHSAAASPEPPAPPACHPTTSAPPPPATTVVPYEFLHKTKEPAPNGLRHWHSEDHITETNLLRDKVLELEATVSAKDNEIRVLKNTVTNLSVHLRKLSRQLTDVKVVLEGPDAPSEDGTKSKSGCANQNHVNVSARVPRTGRVLLHFLGGNQWRGPVNPILQNFAINVYSYGRDVYKYINRTFGGNLPREERVMAWKELRDQLKKLK